MASKKSDRIGNVPDYVAVRPKFDGGGTANYQDSVEILDPDHWILSSQLLDEDDNWVQITTAKHQRSSRQRTHLLYD